LAAFTVRVRRKPVFIDRRAFQLGCDDSRRSTSNLESKRTHGKGPPRWLSRGCRTHDNSDFRWLAYLRDRLGERFVHGLVVHIGDRPLPSGDRLTALPISTPVAMGIVPRTIDFTVASAGRPCLQMRRLVNMTHFPFAAKENRRAASSPTPRTSSIRAIAI
jgi:hypothetical protein